MAYVWMVFVLIDRYYFKKDTLLKKMQKQSLKGILKILKTNRCFPGKMSGNDSLVDNMNILGGSSEDVFQIFQIFFLCCMFLYYFFVDDLIMIAFSGWIF